MDNNEVLDINIASRILALKDKKEEIKEEEKALNEELTKLLKNASKSKETIKIENSNITVELVPETEKEIFDTKKFKIEKSDLVPFFIKKQKNKEKIKIEIKEK